MLKTQCRKDNSCRAYIHCYDHPAKFANIEYMSKWDGFMSTKMPNFNQYPSLAFPWTGVICLASWWKLLASVAQIESTSVINQNREQLGQKTLKYYKL